jgi:hypothetical protein
MSLAHDIDHDHRRVVAQQLTSCGNPYVVAEFDQMGIGYIGGLGDKAAIPLVVENAFIPEVSGVRKTACDEKTDVKFIKQFHYVSL